MGQLEQNSGTSRKPRVEDARRQAHAGSWNQAIDDSVYNHESTISLNRSYALQISDIGVRFEGSQRQVHPLGFGVEYGVEQNLQLGGRLDAPFRGELDDDLTRLVRKEPPVVEHFVGIPRHLNAVEPDGLHVALLIQNQQISPIVPCRHIDIGYVTQLNGLAGRCDSGTDQTLGRLRDQTRIVVQLELFQRG